MPSDNVLSHIFYTRFILSTRSLEKSTLWRSDDVSQIPRQVAGTPRPPSPLRSVHAVLPSDHVPFHICIYHFIDTCVALKILPPGISVGLRQRVSDIPRQVAGTSRPLSSHYWYVRYMQHRSAFLRRSAFFHSSTRIVQQSGSPRDTPRAR